MASHFGTLHLTRQILAHADGRPHVMPGKAIQPPHQGVIITRRPQVWACLPPQGAPFASVAHAGLAGAGGERAGHADGSQPAGARWQWLQRTDQAVADARLARSDQTALAPVLAPHGPDAPARRLAARTEHVGGGGAGHRLGATAARGAWADWERMMAARRAEATAPVEMLRGLGPRLAADAVLLTVDEVLTPKADGSS